MRNFGGIIIGLLFLLAAVPAQAQLAKPDGVPTFVVPSGITVAIWDSVTGVGEYLGFFELGADGHWWGFTGNGISPNFDGLAGAVAAAGGEDPYIAGKLPDLNAILVRRYPPSGTPVGPGATTQDRLNYVLGQAYRFALQNNQTALAHK